MYITYICVCISKYKHRKSYIHVYIYMNVTTINKKGNHKFKRARRVICEGLEGGKGSRK